MLISITLLFISVGAQALEKRPYSTELFETLAKTKGVVLVNIYADQRKTANMARGGINQALIQKVRDALLAKGVTSVNALGNTGSMTTINRYLREIEQENAVRLGDQKLLSDRLKDIVGILAAQMKDEARSLVDAAEERHKEDREARTGSK